MFKDFTAYGKWRDYYNIKNLEVRFSIVVSSIFLLILEYLDFYENFSNYEEMVKNLLLYSIGGMFGLLGFSLSGIAIVISIFGIEDYIRFKNKEIMKKVMSSFVFLAFNIGCAIFLYFIYYLFINSGRNKLQFCSFEIVLFIYIYSISFLIFYTVALVRNCVWLFQIKVGSNETENGYTKAELNEIRIDAILSTMNENNMADGDEMMKLFEHYISKSSIKNKENAISYLEKRYDLKRHSDKE